MNTNREQYSYPVTVATTKRLLPLSLILITKNMSDNVMYSEVFTPCFMPLVFFIPNFHKYGIQIKEGNTNTKEVLDRTITFGYGWAGPSGVTSHTACIKHIDPSSVITGTASGRENLFKFGGWGIRYSFPSKTWAYNARNGQYVEFEETVDTKTTRYRIASENADQVALILRGKMST